MTEYKLTASAYDGGSIEIVFEAETEERALEIAKEKAIEWIKGGEWPKNGCSVSVYYQIETDDFIWDEEEEIVDIDPDEESLMHDAGLDPDCDHEWSPTHEIDGGLDSNPGVYGLGGTAIVEYTHCASCGAHRKIVWHGSQRNPGVPEKSVSFWVD
jgi:hypothetical protein